MEEGFDVSRLKMSPRVAPVLPRQKPKLPRHKPGERFLKGPVAWEWLRRASGLPGKALHVGIALLLFSGMRRSAEIKLSFRWLEEEIGIDRFAGARGLTQLENAGLVSVVRHRGRKPVVTLIEASADQPLSDGAVCIEAEGIQ